MKESKPRLNTPIKIFLFALITLLILLLLAYGIMKFVIFNSNSDSIGIDNGINIALNNSGHSKDDIQDLTTSYNNKSSSSVYEISYVADDYSHFYVIESHTGNILEHEMKKTENTHSQSGDNKEQQTHQDDNQTTGIDAEAAKSIALKDAGLQYEDVTFTKAKLEKEYGVYNYEIEFYTSYNSYEYEISSQNGRIIDRDIDEFDD